jgi:hypothetical protein
MTIAREVNDGRRMVGGPVTTLAGRSPSDPDPAPTYPVSLTEFALDTLETLARANGYHDIADILQAAGPS